MFGQGLIIFLPWYVNNHCHSCSCWNWITFSKQSYRFPHKQNCSYITCIVLVFVRQQCCLFLVLKAQLVYFLQNKAALRADDSMVCLCPSSEYGSMQGHSLIPKLPERAQSAGEWQGPCLSSFVDRQGLASRPWWSCWSQSSEAFSASLCHTQPASQDLERRTAKIITL